MATIHPIDQMPKSIPGIVTVDELIPELQSMYDNGVTRGVHPGWETLEPYYRAQLGQCTFVTGVPSHGKALALDTLIPTTTGWTTMGTIAVGDRVFDEHGVPCVVTYVTDIMEGHPCYEMEFSDGTTVVCDADHEWVTRSDKARRSERNTRSTRRVAQRLSGRFWHGTDQSHKRTFPSAVTTKTIAETLYAPGDTDRLNHNVAVAGALDIQPIALPIPPYVLGAWLGDGSSAGAAIATDDKDVLREIEVEGFITSPWRAKFMHGILGLSTLLRQHGLLNNKHIPLPYFRASAPQRLALLQGMMDTDGSITSYGRCEFSNTRRHLADGVFQLVASLGWKPVLLEETATLYGRVIGEKFRVTFTPNGQVFRLPRKAKYINYNPSHRINWRSIVRCDPCGSVPVRCIKVSSPSSLYLCTKAMIPTHNSRVMSQMILNIMQREGWKFVAFSPEATPARFTKQLIEQYTGKSFDLVPERWRHVHPAIERMSLPELYEAQEWLRSRFVLIDPPTLKHATIEGMLEITRKQIEYDGVQGIVFDPWSWITKTPGRGQQLTDYIGEQLAEVEHFCVRHNVHLWLIAHPTKLQKKESGPYEGLYPPPDLYDISGSAHWFNTGFMGLTVWRNTDTNSPETEIHITKVKFEENGMTGKVILMYDKYTKRYHDQGTEPVRTYGGY